MSVIGLFDMGLIEDLRKRVSEFNTNLENGLYIQNIIWENEAYIVDMNAEIQLNEQGINNLGVDIMDYMPYSEITIAIKEAKGQPTDRVTLHDEGDFAASFFIQANDKMFEIKASDFKTEELVKKYGRQILGLTDSNIEELIWKYLYPELIDKRNTLLYGKD